jgi:tetratricopeptide (TPR) repeat protein
MKQISDFKMRVKILIGAVSLLGASSAFARHEDQAGVYKAEAYKERVATAVVAISKSADYTSIPVSSYAKPAAAPLKGEASVTDQVMAKMKSFFSSPSESTLGQKNAQLPPAGSQNRAPSSVVVPAIQVPASVQHEVTKNLPMNAMGVETYQIINDKIPYLEISKEKAVLAESYNLNSDLSKKFKDYAIAPIATPELIEPKAFSLMTKIESAATETGFSKMLSAKFNPISRAELDALTWMTIKENTAAPSKYVALSSEELKVLNGVLLMRQGDKCAVAVSLFYPLTKNSFYESEGNYFLAMCSKQLGLMTDFYEKARRVIEAEDIYYSKKLFKILGENVPPELIDTLGKALFKISANKKAFEDLDPISKGNVYYILANFGAKTERFKTTLSFSQLVPQKHPKYLEAQFLLALAEYEVGDKNKAMAIQEKLIKELSLDRKNDEFQALVALNLARMQFQEKKFKEARENFLKVSKDHPLWVQSLTEMGWAQLQMSDFGGAIGNMYSVQSPFFNAVYKPESYVIRTIGYLNLCQYGDAYKTLSILEKQYRPFLDKMVAYQQGSGHQAYQTIKTFISSRSNAETDGLPVPIIKEMARHKDFLIRQLALNRQAEEKEIYSRLDKDVETSLFKAQANVTKSRTRADFLKKQIIAAGTNPLKAESKKSMEQELESEFRILNSQFFQIDLFNDAKKAVSAYRAESLKLAEQRIAHSKTELETTLQKRLTSMKEDLIRLLDNNELLRYEVYSGSGENIRYQVAGGEKSNRVPASILPKSKSLQWDFDGEYWEDEIGHYRSSLKNNCSDNRQAGISNGGNQ